jgi:hypothetical protein
MRKIETQMCAAVHNNQNWQSANTSVITDANNLMVVINQQQQKQDLMHFAMSFVLRVKVYSRKTLSGM